MKRIKIWTLALMTVLTCGFMTSCDNDDIIESRILSGEWEGDFKMSYDYEVYDRYGRRYVYTAYADLTNIVFYPSDRYATYGTGTQVDFYNDRRVPYARMYYNFKWEIRNGIIYMTYPYEDRYLNTEIRDYMLSETEFRGYLGWTDTRFCLHKLAGFDWRPYSGGYGYWDNEYYEDYYYPYYAPRKANSTTDSTMTDTKNVRILRVGNIEVNK